jgi:hypothetical protein
VETVSVGLRGQALVRPDQQDQASVSRVLGETPRLLQGIGRPEGPEYDPRAARQALRDGGGIGGPPGVGDEQQRRQGLSPPRAAI